MTIFVIILVKGAWGSVAGRFKSGSFEIPMAKHSMHSNSTSGTQGMATGFRTWISNSGSGA